MDNKSYVNPLITRYASKQMSAVFSDDNKFGLWRRLWVALAESERELGLNITEEQIASMRANVDNIDYALAAAKEKEIRHDVMAHIFAFGEAAPLAKPIIHLGATSCYVGDNADIIVFRQAVKIILGKVISVVKKLSDFAMKYKALPTLGFTHYQPAQLVTVGKRATLWIQDLLSDIDSLEYLDKALKLRGAKGTTGTQASFMQLFDNDFDKVKQLDAMIAQKMGIEGVFEVTGQTYPRKADYTLLSALSAVAQSAFKFSSDIRLLQSMKEVEEPFETAQVGSSAMAYKRNPMRSERISSLARFVLSLPINAAITSGTQWFERTLDDSANRRIAIPQAFLAVDAILELYLNIADNMVVYEKVIHKHIMEELPFMATETILMEGVKAGGDRQRLHEKIRTHSMEAAKRVKVEGQSNDLIERLKQDADFAVIANRIDCIMSPESFTGAAALQVESYVNGTVKCYLDKYKDYTGAVGVVNV